jgi:hypothetical protein
MLFRRVMLIAAILASSSSNVFVHGRSSSSTSSSSSLARPAPFGVVDTAQQQKQLVKSVKTTPITITSSRVLPRGGDFASQKGAVILGLVLALNSGFINGCCLSGAVSADGAKQAVAAVTASWTNSALGAAGGNMSQFGYLAKVIVSFLSGSAIAAFLNPKPTQFEIKTSSYGLPLAIGAGLLVVASHLLKTTDTVKTAFLLCAMANGIQNSVTSTMTGNLCRSSHYSGITSDMGTFIGQILGGNKANVYKLKVFMALSACFWAGGYIAYSVGKEFGSSSLLFAAGLYAVVIALYESFAKTL